MNLEPYRAIFEEAELTAELAEAEQTITELRRMVGQLDLAIANYADVLDTYRNRTP